MFDALLDLLDSILGSTDIPDSPDVTPSGNSDVHFGSSSAPVCASCGGTGRSLYPSSGTTGVCYACGGSGH